MDDELENPELRLKPYELLAFQRELKEEKELLQQILEKIDNQIHALQVEQLHLLGIMNKSLAESDKESEKKKHESAPPEKEPIHTTLDLSIPTNIKFEEESEDDED